VWHDVVTCGACGAGGACRVSTLCQWQNVILPGARLRWWSLMQTEIQVPHGTPQCSLRYQVWKPCNERSRRSSRLGFQLNFPFKIFQHKSKVVWAFGSASKNVCSLQSLRSLQSLQSLQSLRSPISNNLAIPHFWSYFLDTGRHDTWKHGSPGSDEYQTHLLLERLITWIEKRRRRVP
jgi:hypothetical protein